MSDSVVVLLWTTDGAEADIFTGDTPFSEVLEYAKEHLRAPNDKVVAKVQNRNWGKDGESFLVDVEASEGMLGTWWVYTLNPLFPPPHDSKQVACIRRVTPKRPRLCPECSRPPGLVHKPDCSRPPR
jgi:hypothetical protein